jgi:RiboL-PSP-HEPN
MARYTSAYSSLILRLDEVELLRRSAAAKERDDPINLRYDINAFCRAGIVLLCAHLEAYIKELGEVALTNIHAKSVPRAILASQFFYHLSKDILDEVQDTSDPIKVASKVFHFLQHDATYWDRVGSFPQPLPVDRFNKGFSNPAFQKIRAYFNRFGCADYKTELARKLKADYTVTVNMVDHLVDTRNKIAHGDPSVTKTPNDVKDMIRIIRAYCQATDVIFASWCKRELCTIR